MTIGTVTGLIHSTISHKFYQAKALLLVEREDAAGHRTGAYLIAVDTVGAGVGQVVGSADAPVRSAIVGIIDEVHLAQVAERTVQRRT
jgi:microcompartment protein CcmK/EutM